MHLRTVYFIYLYVMIKSNNLPSVKITPDSFFPLTLSRPKCKIRESRSNYEVGWNHLQRLKGRNHLRRRWRGDTITQVGRGVLFAVKKKKKKNHHMRARAFHSRADRLCSAESYLGDMYMNSPIPVNFPWNIWVLSQSSNGKFVFACSVLRFITWCIVNI